MKTSASINVFCLICEFMSPCESASNTLCLMRYRNKASYTFNDAEADANHGGLRRRVQWRRLMRKVLFCRCERPRPPASSHTHWSWRVSERVSLSSGCRSFLNFARAAAFQYFPPCWRVTETGQSIPLFKAAQNYFAQEIPV
jgi:hypothetical protein